ASYARDRGLGRVVDDRARRSARTPSPADSNDATRRVTADGELRRLRSGGTARSDIRANADAPRERSLADVYRRSRVTDGRVTRDIDARRTAPANEGRATRSFDPSSRSGRGTPNRSGLATQARTPPSTFARIAPAPRAQAPASRPTHSREQPISWPGAGGARPSSSQAEHRTPSRGAPHAQPGTRPMPHDAGAGLNGGRLQSAGRGQSRR
ncbi:MAG TPA: hypothetical protein VLD39_17420, partial [Gammaproteobacteria bacterium]|nr:hypothetical protein [Gammaproteobacteria bacterium]